MTTAPANAPYNVNSGKTTSSGWLSFAGILAIVLGLFNVLDGIVGLFKSNYYLVTDSHILAFNFTTWGWIWLIVGIVQVIVGFGVLAGQMWARVVGVGLAVIAAIGQLAFLQAFPWWSVLSIGLSVLVIYALTVPPTKATGY
jgi:hypothetical protein